MDVSQASFFEESLNVYAIGIPAMITQVIFFLVQMTNMYFAGHLEDPCIVAGVGLGNMTINLLGRSIIESFNSAIDTLGPPAVGSGRYDLVYMYLKRGRLMILICLVPIFLMLCNVHFFYIWLKQDREAVD